MTEKQKSAEYIFTLGKHYLLQFQNKGEKLTVIKWKKHFLLIQDFKKISLHSTPTKTKE